MCLFVLYIYIFIFLFFFYIFIHLLFFLHFKLLTNFLSVIIFYCLCEDRATTSVIKEEESTQKKTACQPNIKSTARRTHGQKKTQAMMKGEAHTAQIQERRGNEKRRGVFGDQGKRASCSSPSLSPPPPLSPLPFRKEECRYPTPTLDARTHTHTHIPLLSAPPQQSSIREV